MEKKLHFQIIVTTCRLAEIILIYPRLQLKCCQFLVFQVTKN